MSQILYDRPRNILLVEDDLDVREMISEEMAIEGWKVHCALEPEVIREVIRDCTLVVLDWHLHGYNKNEIQEVCAIRPIIVISVDVGVNVPGILHKPFPPSVLNNRLAEEFKAACSKYMVGDVAVSILSPDWGDCEITSLENGIAVLRSIKTGKEVQTRTENLRPVKYVKPFR
jgi:CheY-like chemotaxis protein